MIRESNVHITPILVHALLLVTHMPNLMFSSPKSRRARRYDTFDDKVWWEPNLKCLRMTPGVKVPWQYDTKKPFYEMDPHDTAVRHEWRRKVIYAGASSMLFPWQFMSWPIHNIVLLNSFHIICRYACQYESRIGSVDGMQNRTSWCAKMRSPVRLYLFGVNINSNK